jgi:hypothetical protein
VERIDMAIARQQRGKHVSAELNTDATIEEAAFPVVCAKVV